MIGLVFLILIVFSLVFFLIWLWFFKESKEPVENFYKLALKAFEAGDYKKAKELFSQDPKLDSNMDAKYKLGVAYLKLKEYEEAKGCFEAVLRKSPKNKDALYNLAQVLQAQGDYEEAINVFNKLAKEDPKSNEGALNISNVHVAQGDFEKALDILENAKKNSPDDSKLLFAIAKCKSKMCDVENDEACKELLEEFIKLSNRQDLPNEFHIALAKAYAINGEADKALEACQKAISLKSEDMEAYQLLGLIQLIQQDYEKAKSNLTIALNFQPNNKETHNIFSYLFCKQVDDCPLQECREKYYKLVKKYLK